ncbi:MAG: hypothetical protein HY293_09450 [Planctomycetes bacterium]|nr:hypothetical protein [Planctomycetota bacterium]
MRPGSADVPVRVKIGGAELREPKKLTGAMAESFGLDRRIEAYRGKRPIRFYRWDLDCLEGVVDDAVKEAEAARRGQASRTTSLKRLQMRIHALREMAYEELR